MPLAVRRGGSWVPAGPEDVRVYRNGSWSAPLAVYIRQGGAWKVAWAPVDPSLVEVHTPSATLQNSGNAYVTPLSQALATSVFVRVTARVEGYVFAGVYTQEVWVEWDIEYRVNGGPWSLLRHDRYESRETSSLLFPERWNRSVERSYTINTSPAVDEKIEVRVIHRGEGHNGQGYFGGPERDGTWVRVDRVEIRHAWEGLV